MKKSEMGKRLDNRGAALATVIVVVAIVSVLATTFLYVSGKNYFMKVTDQKTKMSFYQAETALEEIKAELMELSSEAGAKAYMDVLVQYSSSDGYSRYSAYRSSYFAELAGLWEAKRTADPANVMTYEQLLQSCADPIYASALTLDATLSDAGTMDISHSTDGYALLKGVCIEYTDADGYTTIITTDYLFTVPELNWSVDQALTDWSDGTYEPEKLKRDTVDMSECVQYCNWVKK